MSRSATPGVDEPVDGSQAACSDFRVEILNILDLITVDFDIADEGWTWVRNGNSGLPKYRSISGVAEKSKIAHNDTPANHNSHDHNTDVLVDPGQAGVLSNVNGPNNEDTDNVDVIDPDTDVRTPTKIELEWEIGTFPNEKGQSVPERYFPKWAWPNVGDRVWANGHWVFDCGHGKRIGTTEQIEGIINTAPSYHRSEIHPPRAIASMRSQADTLPGTGTTRVPVTATDLYVHGRAGFVVDQLSCGMGIIVNGYDGGGPDACPTKTTPIAENFEFDVCLPPRQHAEAQSNWRIADGPGNTVTSAALQVNVTRVRPAPAGCANDDVDPVGADQEESYDLGEALHVLVPLGGSGVADTAVYARRIVAGWVEPPATPLPHLQMTLDRMNLHFSGDGGVIASDDGELTFFWANVDRAPDEWVRLADYAPVASNGNSKMNDYDPSPWGDSFMSLGAVFDFYVRYGQTVNVHANGYDQDCYDGSFGDHHFTATSPYISCAFDIDETGNNDPLDQLAVSLEPPDYAGDPALGACPGIDPASGVGSCNVRTIPKCRLPFGLCPDATTGMQSDYELDFTLRRLPLTNEDTADLAVSKSCTFAGEVALPNHPLTCTVTIVNHGPGLPRGVTLTDTVSGLAGDVAIGAPSVTIAGAPSSSPCTVSSGAFSCTLYTVPVGGSATVTVTITPGQAGTLGNAARATTASADPEGGNDDGRAEVVVYLPVDVDVRPGGTPNPVNLGSGGLIPVAILGTPTFDARTVGPASVCFGDDGAPAERACTEAHGAGQLEDVDRDGDVDLVLHYRTPETGIDAGDTAACLTGTTAAGIRVFGCDAIVTR